MPDSSWPDGKGKTGNSVSQMGNGIVQGVAYSKGVRADRAPEFLDYKTKAMPAAYRAKAARAMTKGAGY